MADQVADVLPCLPGAEPFAGLPLAALYERIDGPSVAVSFGALVMSCLTARRTAMAVAPWRPRSRSSRPPACMMSGISEEAALRPVREDDLPMLEELTQDPAKTGEFEWGGPIFAAGGEAGTKMA